METLWQRMGAFNRLDRLASKVPYGMVWYGTVCVSISMKIIWQRLGAYGSVWQARQAGKYKAISEYGKYGK